MALFFFSKSCLKTVQKVLQSDIHIFPVGFAIVPVRNQKPGLIRFNFTLLN